MAAKNDTPDAKERSKLVDAIDAELREAEKWARDVAGGASDIDRAIKAIRDKVAAAQKDSSPKGLQTLKTQLKPAKDIQQAAFKRMSLVYDRNRREALRAETAAMLAQARMNVSRITDKALTAIVVAQITAMAKKVDAVEATKDNIKAMAQYGALDAEVRAVIAATTNAIAVDGWTRGKYQAMRARVEASIKRLPSDRLRKLFAAELASVEDDRQGCLQILDVAKIEYTVGGNLRDLDAQVARLCAVSPAIDRELARIGEMLHKAGRPPAAMESLRALVQQKASNWPRSSRVDEMAREVDAFEAAVAKFAALAAKEAAAAAKTAKA